VRGPNRQYACTSGPDGKQCRRCERERIRAVNDARKLRRLPPVSELPALTMAEVASSRRNPCPCEPCRLNRERAAMWRKEQRCTTTDADLDHRALQRWPAEWGDRA
jgi:hypothetical protein